MAGGDVGAVAQLEGWIEVEILDLDPTVDEKKVWTTLQDAILRRSDNSPSGTATGTVDIIGL